MPRIYGKLLMAFDEFTIIIIYLLDDGQGIFVGIYDFDDVL